MNTPMTNELEKFLLESNALSDLGKFQRMTGHARWFETQLIAEQEKVRELLEAMATMARNALKGMEATK